MGGLITASKILIIVGLVMAGIGFIGMVAGGILINFMLYGAQIPFFGNYYLFFIAGVVLIGAIIASFSLRDIYKGKNKRAAILSLIAAFVPPLSIIFLIAGILILVDENR